MGSGDVILTLFVLWIKKSIELGIDQLLSIMKSVVRFLFYIEWNVLNDTITFLIVKTL